MEHGRTTPEQRDVVPRQRRRHDGYVHETRRGGVAKVERGEVEEVDDEGELGPDEVVVHPEQHEDELQTVRDDVVRAQVRGGRGPGGVGGEERIEVAELGGEEGDPR